MFLIGLYPLRSPPKGTHRSAVPPGMRPPRSGAGPGGALPALRRGALAGVLALFAASAAAQDPAPGFGPPPIPTGPQPQIEVVEVEHDFGKVTQGTVVTHSFTVKNRGTAPLRILKVQSNCGCTSTFFTEEVLPGAEGRVELRIDTASVAGGSHRKNATISSDDPAAPQLTLWMVGEVVPLLQSSAPALKVTGLCEEPKEGLFRFTPGTDRPTAVVGARLRGGLLEVVSLSPLDGGGAEIHLRAPPGAEPGLIRDELLLGVRLGEADPVETSYPVVIEHLDRIRITPGGNIVFFRRQTAHLESDPPREVSKEIHVQSARPDLPFRVTGARIEGVPEGLFTTEVREETPGQHYVITIRVQKTVPEAQVQGRLVIETDDAARPRREREVFAQFRPGAPPG